MAVDRIKYVNVNSGTEDTDFVDYTNNGSITASITITQNGTYYAPHDISGYNKVIVNVPSAHPAMYGVEINNLLGDVDENGTMLNPDPCGSITLEGIKIIPYRALFRKFQGWTFQNNSVFSAPDLVEVQGTDELLIGGLYEIFYSTTGLTTVSMPNLTNIQTYGMYRAFAESDVSEIDFSSLQTIAERGMYYAFYTTKVENVSFPELLSVGERGMYYVFNGCQQLKTFSAHKLEIVYGYGFYYAFSGCVSLVSFSAPELDTVHPTGFQYAFADCPELSSVDFSKLRKCYTRAFSGAFRNCVSLTSISFPALESIETQVFGSSANTLAFTGSGVTEIHFPATMKSAIEDLYGYSDKFGATNATIYFDL